MSDLIAFAYIVPEGFAIDITNESGDLVRQLLQIMRERGYRIPRRLVVRANRAMGLAA